MKWTRNSDGELNIKVIGVGEYTIKKKPNGWVARFGDRPTSFHGRTEAQVKKQVDRVIASFYIKRRVK